VKEEAQPEGKVGYWAPLPEIYVKVTASVMWVTITVSFLHCLCNILQSFWISIHSQVHTVNWINFLSSLPICFFSSLKN
jgi:hypothetical protein